MLVPLYVRTLQRMPVISSHNGVIAAAMSTTTTGMPLLPPSVKLFDVDANLAHPALKADAKQLVLDAHRIAHVDGVFVPASNLVDAVEIEELLETLRNDADICERNIRFHSSLGIHPYHAASFMGDDVTSRLRDAAVRMKPKTLGEVRIMIRVVRRDWTDYFPPSHVSADWTPLPSSIFHPSINRSPCSSRTSSWLAS